ncbi:MAG: AAA family ATPase [Thermaerobacter sp.]|nr:AAA family ATPase [Thermaerobacter sp.]
MILRGWRIEGFGRFHDAEVGGLLGGLTVIEGPNEAGKSTLLGFLRFMLFGFQRGQSQKYPPLGGGRHGGRLYFSDARGDWQLERFQGKPPRLIAPDGSVLGEDALAALLGRIDGAIYRDVFAFSLWELSNLEALSQEEVRDRLYSVGLTGAGKSASAARRTLEQRLEQFLRQRSSEGRINKLLAQLSEVRQKLQAAQLQAQDFSDLEHREGEAEEQVQRLQHEAAQLREQRDRLLKLQTLESTWNRLCRLEEELGRPAQAIDMALAEEAAGLIEGQQHRSLQIEEREEEERGLAARVATLSPPEELVAVAPVVEELVQDLTLQDQRLRRLDELARLISERRLERSKTAARLNLPEEEPAVALDFSIHQEIDHWAARLRDRQEKLRHLAQAAEAAAREAADAQLEAQAAQAAFAPYAEMPDAATLDRRIAAIISLQRSLERSHARRSRLLGLGALGIALLLAGAIGLLSHILYLAAPTVVGVLVLLFTAFGGSGRALSQAMSDARDAAAEAGIAFPVAERDLERLHREAEAQKSLATERDRLAQRASESVLLAQRRQGDAETAKAALADEQAQSLMDQEAFGEFKRQRGLPTGLSPDLLPSYASELQVFARVQADLASLEAEAVKTWQSAQTWLEQAAEQLRMAERDVPSEGPALGRALRELGEDVRDARSAAAQVRELCVQLDDLRSRLEGMRKHQQAAKERIGALLASLGARDASELRLLMQAAQVRAQFADQAGPAAAEIIAELRHGDPIVRRAGEEAINERLQRIQDIELKEALGKALDLRKQREQVSQAADVAEFAAQEERVVTELRRAVGEWRAVFAAKRLLERTLEVYERDRQPEVLRFASDALARITAGRYVGVRQRADEKGLMAVEASGDLRPPEELSRGTAEQLYLSLRLGLAASYGERVAALPLVLDDVLVNFDPTRARAVLSILGEFASAPDRQALLFTCHPFVREMAEEGLQGIRTLRLPQPIGVREAAAALAPGDAPDQKDPDEVLAVLAGGAMPLRTIVQELGQPEEGVRRRVEELIREGRVEATGERRGRRYRLTENSGLFGG